MHDRTAQFRVAMVVWALWLAAIVQIIRGFLVYRRYYAFLKAQHPDIWRRLMVSDPFVESFGEWYGWPFGSGSLIYSFFLRRYQAVADEVVLEWRSRSIRHFVWAGIWIGIAFAVAFVFRIHSS